MNQIILAFLSAMLVLSPFKIVKAEETGRKAPNCKLTSLDGAHQYNLEQFHGKVLYVDFWASWCGPCMKSFPFLNKLGHELGDLGLQVIAVNLDEIPEDAQGFLARNPAHFTVATDTTGQCAKDFGVKAMPSSYLVDRNGVIRHLHLGFRPGEAEEFRTLVEQLLAERQTGS